MNLFLDEDNGTGIPKALNLVKPSMDAIHYPSNKNHQLIKRGTKDRDWIPVVGEQGWLVFSQNKWMVNNEEERLLLIANKVGIVYLDTGSELAFPVMKMLLNRWEWLRALDADDAGRPFAHLITIGGKHRPLDLSLAAPLGRTKLAGAVQSQRIFGTASTPPPAVGPAAVRLRLPGL